MRPFSVGSQYAYRFAGGQGVRLTNVQIHPIEIIVALQMRGFSEE